MKIEKKLSEVFGKETGYAMKVNPYIDWHRPGYDRSHTYYMWAGETREDYDNFKKHFEDLCEEHCKGSSLQCEYELLTYVISNGSLDTDRVILNPTDEDLIALIKKEGPFSINEKRQTQILSLGLIELSNGSYLYNNYGKYTPGISFLSKDIFAFDQYPIKMTLQELNLDQGTSNVEGVRGEYFTSKKGTKCFRINPNGKHWLLRYSWGGSFNEDSGYQIFELPNKLYERRARSNGGGTGYDYVIVPVGTTRILSEDDI